MEQIVKLKTYTAENDAIFGDGKVDPNMDSIKYAKQTKKLCGTKNGSITSELLDVFLYGKRRIQGIDLENAKRQKIGQGKCVKPLKWCEICRKAHNGACHTNEQQKSIRQIVGNAIHDIKLTYAVLSFPAEVQLCTSSIPGYTYGVSARLPFPIGTWIGPYEGKRVKAEDVSTKSDSNYVWEIYEDGKFSHYLDGNDENNSSWMRFIRCARHKDEQNMVVFQYGNNIYYRAVRDIPAGNELLVWYNNNYTQFLGVPLGLRNVPGCKSEQDKKMSAQTGSPVPQAEVKPVLKEKNIDLNHTDSYMKTPVLYSPNKTPATSVTYCYSASKPALQQISYSNGTTPGITLNNTMTMDKPTATIEHKPVLPNGIKSHDRIMSPGNGEQRQQHVTHCLSPNSDVNNNYFTFSPRISSPSTCSTSSISIASEDRGSPRVSHTSPRENHVSQRENHISPRENHASPRSEISPRESENPEFYKPPEKPYQCGHCSSSFAQPSELSAHVVTHTNDRPFKCGFCGRAFAGASTLYNHMRTHTGNRAFLCQKCGCTLDTATQLSRHMRTPGECPQMIIVSTEAVPAYTSTMTRG